MSGVEVCHLGGRIPQHVDAGAEAADAAAGSVGDATVIGVGSASSGRKAVPRHEGGFAREAAPTRLLAVSAAVVPPADGDEVWFRVRREALPTRLSSVSFFCQSSVVPLHDMHCVMCTIWMKLVKF